MLEILFLKSVEVLQPDIVLNSDCLNNHYDIMTSVSLLHDCVIPFVKACERWKRFNQETISTICYENVVCAHSNMLKNACGVACSIKWGGGSECETLKRRSEHDTLEGREVSRN